MIEGLQVILEKDIIVSTVNSADLLANAEKVESIYQHHVATFIPMGDMRDVAGRLAKSIRAEKTVKGLLTAPYGYGKTSSLAFLWRNCEEQGLLAVPPFYCATWHDILEASYGWIRFRLSQLQPGLLESVDAVYRRYTELTLQDMSREYSQEHGIATSAAANILEDLLDRGALHLQLSPASLLKYLDEITDVVVEAGFHGLALFPDEFQQYFSKGTNLRQSIQEFREFVWGLDTRTAPLGVIFSLPTYAESIVQEQGKDILHRLKDDQLYYRLSDIYSNDFPAMLWDRYSVAFNLSSLSAQIIEAETLQSIGQIVEREDLGEGPRTVIECFKRAIIHYDAKQRPYAPTDLIDDFIEANIQFQAQSNRLKNVTRQALSSGVVDSQEKRDAIKLLAAFPRGCPVTIQKRYGLYDAVNQLSRQAHGDLLTHLAEGYTLLGLQRGDAPVRTVDLIITEFWRGFEEDELHLEAARDAFTNHLLGKVFQRRRGAAATGWGELVFTLAATGSSVSLIEGTFNPQFPRRRLRIQSAFLEEDLLPCDPDTDIFFDFLLELDEHDSPGRLEQPEDNRILFHLNVRRKYSMHSMPEDIRKLQDFMNPELVTPLLILSLINYFNRWEQIKETTIPENEKPEISFFVDRLLNNCTLLLFNEGLGRLMSSKLDKIGYRMPEDAFNHICERIYPNYHTFFVSPQYDSVLNDYVNATRDLSLKQKRGRIPVQSSKEALARRFGLGSVATFENRARNEYQYFLRIESWSGNDAEIVLTLHPLEREILELLQTAEPRQLDGEEVHAIQLNRVADYSTQLGYRQEETLKALELLVARRYIRVDTDKKLALLVRSGLQRERVEEHIGQVSETLDGLPEHALDQEEEASLSKRLEQLREHLAVVRDDDEEELDELSGRVVELADDLRAVINSQRDNLRQRLNNRLLELERSLSLLQQSDVLSREVRGQVAFVMHLNELRRLLLADRDALARRYEVQRETVERALNIRTESSLSDLLRLDKVLNEVEQALEKFEEQRELLEQRTKYLVQWVNLLSKADSLFGAFGIMPDLSERFANDFVGEVMAHFVKRRNEKRDSLADWEPFAELLEQFSQELEARRRQGNELFAKKKEELEELLRDSGIGDWRLRSRYTYGEDLESYEDLYQEVRTKLELRLGELAENLSNTNTDWLKARYIHSATEAQIAQVEQLADVIDGLRERSDDLQQALSLELVRSANEEFARFVSVMNELNEATSEVRKQLANFLFADHDLSEQEAAILPILQPRADLDLTDVFVGLHTHYPGMTLDELMSILEGLYRKNRIVIRMRRRT